MLLAAARWADLTEWFNEIRSRLKTDPSLLPDSERKIADLPQKRSEISVETALNSRCTSDHDDNQRLFHWGLFDLSKRLPDTEARRIAQLAAIPRFTGEAMEITVTGRRLTFQVDDTPGGQLKRWLMVESGMQQQAVCLVCAALGAGMIFDSMGLDGRSISGGRRAVMAFDLDAMKPSYAGDYWTDSIPDGLRPWQKGNLEDPVRKGSVPLLSAMGETRIARTGSTRADETVVSQLLWAARGRTPHLYKSKAWGMTIPTWAGLQNISQVYLSMDRSIYRYENWANGMPTHGLQAVGRWSSSPALKGEERPGPGRLIVIAAKERTGRAWWEVGYQLFNILVQATAMDLAYTAFLLSDEEQSSFSVAGIPDVVAGVTLT